MSEQLATSSPRRRAPRGPPATEADIAEASASGPAGGLLVVLVVDAIDDEYARLQREGVEITTAIETEPWGERYFQMTDPNGVVIQLVQWVDESEDAYSE